MLTHVPSKQTPNRILRTCQLSQPDDHDNQQERQVAHMSSELATIRQLSRSDSNRMPSTGTSTGSSPVIRSGGSGSLTTRSTVATDPLVHASTRPNSPKRPA